MSEEIKDGDCGVENYYFHPPRECDVCRKILAHSGATVWFSQHCRSKESEKDLQHNFGDYQIGKEYIVCWECVLRRLGVKP